MTENLIEIDVLSQNITAIAFLIMVNLDTPVSGGIVLLIKWLCQMVWGMYYIWFLGISSVNFCDVLHMRSKVI